MQVRGAPLIGATAAYGVALALHMEPSERRLGEACSALLATRPTAVNLNWALQRMRQRLTRLDRRQRSDAAYAEAAAICEEDVATNSAIGDHAQALITAIWKTTARTVNILTHCNAGWLATVDWGTALAGIYKAADAGVPIHVWVDETRPRNQGAHLTAWELGEHGVKHTLIVDNTGGHLMQRGLVDICLVGTDRTAANGDVCNKIGTYLKALAASDNDVPFYVALPSSTVDWALSDGVSDTPIEQRASHEVTHVYGKSADGLRTRIQVGPDGVTAANYAFDVTPARLITGLITERGVCSATLSGLRSLFPDAA